MYGFAKGLQKKIDQRFGLPVSIGIAKSKWIAKLATGSAKPYGVYEVKEIDSYIEKMPIEAFPGIGKGFQKRLKAHYISTLGELRRNRSLLYGWKKPGIQLYKRITGTDGETVEIARGTRKSIGISRTFDAVYSEEEIRRRIMVMARHIVYLVMDMGANPTTFYLKINYEYGIKVKRSETVDRLFSEQIYKRTLEWMFCYIHLYGKGAVKLTLNVSNFTSQHTKTLSLLDYEEDRRSHTLTKKLHELRKRFGLDIVKTGNEL
jgi:DNA polymerase-4